MMYMDQGGIGALTISISWDSIQNVSSPKNNGSVGGCEWEGCGVSPLIGRVNLNKDVNIHKIWSLPDDNVEELTVLSAVLHLHIPHQRIVEMTWIVAL